MVVNVILVSLQQFAIEQRAAVAEGLHHRAVELGEDDQLGARDGVFLDCFPDYLL